MARGKRSIAVDLKRDQGRALVRKIADRSDVLIDPFRPGVLEGLGLGPVELHKYVLALLLSMKYFSKNALFFSTQAGGQVKV